MKGIGALVLVCLSTGGCVTMGTMPRDHDSSLGASSSMPATSPTKSDAPRLVIPATGGAPTVGIPLGGSLYLPVTGGPPIVGIPTTP
jgi:hypothetical protein